MDLAGCNDDPGAYRPDGTVCWLDVKTRDPAGTAEFFSAALGWRCDIDRDDWRSATVISTGGHRIGGLSDLATPIYPPDLPPHIAYYLAVTDIDTRVTAARTAGAEIVLAPFEAGDDGRIATLLDPYGVAVSLWERAPRRGWTHTPGVPAAPTRLQHISNSPADAADFYTRILGIHDTMLEFLDSGRSPHHSTGWGTGSISVRVFPAVSLSRFGRRASGRRR